MALSPSARVGTVHGRACQIASLVLHDESRRLVARKIIDSSPSQIVAVIQAAFLREHALSFIRGHALSFVCGHALSDRDEGHGDEINPLEFCHRMRMLRMSMMRMTLSNRKKQ